MITPLLGRHLTSASTRVMLWRRLQHWALGVAQFAAADSLFYRDDTPA